MAMSVEVVLLMTASLKRSRDVELLATDWRHAGCSHCAAGRGIGANP